MKRNIRYVGDTEEDIVKNTEKAKTMLKQKVSSLHLCDLCCHLAAVRTKENFQTIIGHIDSP